MPEPDAPPGQIDFNNNFVEGEDVPDYDGLFFAKHPSPQNN